MSSSVEALNREKASVARLSIFSNLALVVLKLAAGFAIGSVSVISEAIHSGIDLVAALIAYFSVRQSSRPPDEEHEFGHGKLENISGAVEAVLIFVAAALIIWESYNKLVHGSELEDVSIGIVVMLISAVANFFVSGQLMKTARRTDSIALEADAWHLRTDVFTSLGIFAGLIAIKLTGWKILDPLFAMLVALFILKAALELTLKAVRDLMDTKLPASEQAEIMEIIGDHARQYVGFHRLRTRKSGSDRFVDLHLVVSRELNIEQAHGLADHIEQDIRERYPRSSVIIHLEPCGDSCNCDRCRASGCSSRRSLAPEE